MPIAFKIRKYVDLKKRGGGVASGDAVAMTIGEGYLGEALERFWDSRLQ